VQTSELLDEGNKNNEQNSSLGSNSSSDGNKKSSFNKGINFGRSSCQLRTRGFKNSKRDSQNAINSSKRIEKYNSFTKGCEIPSLECIFCFLLIVFIGDELNFKTSQKSIRNLAHSKSKEEQANSENCNSESKEPNKEKMSIAQKEKSCQNWIKFLNKLESQITFLASRSSSEEGAPEFCSNKT
jgi:hypothetical protein